MAQSAIEARQQILDELGDAVDQLALAVACLGEAFEQLAVGAAERLEGGLFRPVQRAYARGQRTHSGFAGRCGLPTRQFELPVPGGSSQGARAFVERAVSAAAEADRLIAELQDSLLPVESGDPELRTGLSEVRDALGPIPVGARELLRALGR
jgi:hypothetical protein